eukprot:13029292-Alexandrium_andersonii.AAC.1
MSASLVGSEMCIRDSFSSAVRFWPWKVGAPRRIAGSLLTLPRCGCGCWGSPRPTPPPLRLATGEAMRRSGGG